MYEKLQRLISAECDDLWEKIFENTIEFYFDDR